MLTPNSAVEPEYSFILKAGMTLIVSQGIVPEIHHIQL